MSGDEVALVEVVVLEVEPGVDPMPAFDRAWARGARVLPLPRTLPAAAREALVARVRVVRAGHDAVRGATRGATRGSTPGAMLGAGLVLPTSGSSGVPRLIDISLEAMQASALLGAHAVPFGPGDRWHGSLAPSHIGGIMILMRARHLGGTVRFGAPPRAWSDLAGCTHVSLVAAQLARLLDDPAPVPASLKAVMLGGGPSPRALHDRAIARGVPLYSTYGMTETCSQVATGRRLAGDPETLAGPPLPGVSITIDPACGEILVDGPTLARGEIVDGAILPLQRPLRTRDVGELDALGRLHVVGRLDSMFISGGRNIHPETIERALLAIDGVRSACVVAVPDARWGMRPVAFIDAFVDAFVGASVDATAPAMLAALREALEPHLVPDRLLAMPADEAALMKPSRARLAARLAAGERFAEHA